MASDRYRPRPRTVRAHIVLDLDEARTWLEQFADCTPTVTAFHHDRYLKVYSLPGGDSLATFVARPGQTIVREGEGWYRVVPNSGFSRDFESVLDSPD